MIPPYDIEYSLAREAEERAAAKAATYPAARDIHFMLADRYADRAWAAREKRCEADNGC
jgi:hypothetical protein